MGQFNYTAALITIRPERFQKVLTYVSWLDADWNLKNCKLVSCSLQEMMEDLNTIFGDWSDAEQGQKRTA